MYNRTVPETESGASLRHTEEARERERERDGSGRPGGPHVGVERKNWVAGTSGDR